MTTSTDEGDPVGITISAFSSLSLRPPLVLFCLDVDATHIEAFAAGSHFVVNVLAEDQRYLSDLFASSSNDWFAGIDMSPSADGCPVLPGCLATLECRRTATYEGGDHLILIGQVERTTVSRKTRPLLYYRGRYAALDANG